jgi:hypothetical protein
MGEERARDMTKRALCSFVLAEEAQSCETLLGYAWLSERLCDEELLQILAEVANRCLQDGPVEDTRLGDDFGKCAATTKLLALHSLA